MKIKQITALEKIRSLAEAEENVVISKAAALAGEIYSYQIVVESEGHMLTTIKTESALSDSINIYAVRDVVMDVPLYMSDYDDQYLTDKPGLMPDLLEPVNGDVFCKKGMNVFLAEVKIPQNCNAGEYEIKFDVSTDNPEIYASSVMTLEVLNKTLPEQKTTFTQWFHTDCIASAHNVEVYSEQHWQLIEAYVKMAVELGINMILTPVITPPLDTKIGGRRPCTQLVRIEKNGDKYSFDFTLLRRWIDMCNRCGVKYFEISHLFSQWGCKYSPNITVYENGKAENMFGWHVETAEGSYGEFLKQFLPELTAFLRNEGVAERCRFHVSDEPMQYHLESYRYAYELVKPLLDGFTIMDALSDIDFYEHGLVENPVCCNDHIEPFIEKKVKNLWTYNCCAQSIAVSNRFMSMPHYRNRIIGFQMYKYGIEGFLHWGYNFYYSQYSVYPINPYVISSAGGSFPSGDSFSVYPGKNGPLPSTRAFVFREALQDIELCRLLESYIGKDKVIELIEKEAGMEITFKQYPKNKEFIFRVTDKMKEMLRSFE